MKTGEQRHQDEAFAVIDSYSDYGTCKVAQTYFFVLSHHT